MLRLVLSLLVLVASCDAAPQAPGPMLEDWCSSSVMSTILTEANAFTDNVTSPNPGEPVRAGGGTGTPITLGGNNGDVNGGLVYSAVVQGAQIRQLGGAGQALAVTVNGQQITVQLATDGGGVPTSTANQVVTAYNLVAAATALATISVTGTGAGIAGVSSGFTQLAAGALGSIRTGLQLLTNRSRYLFNLAQAVPYLPFNKPTVWCEDGATLNIGNVSVVVLGSGSTWLFGGVTQPGMVSGTGQGATTLTPAKAASTWYYLYAFINGTSSGQPRDWPLSYEVSTTGPNGDGYKNGDVTRRYICAYRTNNVPNIVPFQFDGNETVFTQQGYTSSPNDNLVLTSGNQTSWTNVNLASFVPAGFAKPGTVRLWYQFSNQDGADRTANVKPGSNSDANNKGREIGARTTAIVNGELTISLVESTTIQYQIPSLAAGGLWLAVASYREVTY